MQAQLQQQHKIAGQAGAALQSDGSSDGSDVDDVQGDEDGGKEHVDEDGNEAEDGDEYEDSIDEEDGSDEDDCGEDGDAGGVDGECICSIAVHFGQTQYTVSCQVLLHFRCVNKFTAFQKPVRIGSCMTCAQ